MGKIKTLKNCPLFSDLDIEELASIASTAQWIHLSSGDALDWKGDGLILIAEGSMEVRYKNPSTQTMTHETLEKNETLGELALLSNHPLSSNEIPFKLQSNRDSELLFIPSKTFLKNLEFRPTLGPKLLPKISNLVRGRIFSMHHVLGSMLSQGLEIEAESS